MYTLNTFLLNSKNYHPLSDEECSRFKVTVLFQYLWQINDVFTLQA